MGVAYWRCVRPVLMTGQNSLLFASSAFCSCCRAGISSSAMATADETWIEVAMTSLDDWHRLTWSFGCRSLDPSLPARISDARLAMTSLALVLVDVPEPVW